MNQPDVTIVICAHLARRWPHLRRAVDSAAGQQDVAARVLLVVDGDPELAALARRHLADRCEVLVRPERGGLSAAKNSALEQVTTPLVAFLDDDAVADPRWLATMVDQLGPHVVGVGGRSVPNWESGTRPAWFPEELLWAVGCAYKGMPTRPATVRNVFGGCALFRTELFHRIGGFRTDLGRQATGAAGCEETELCLRATARRPDDVFVYAPDAVIHHFVPRERASSHYVLRRSLAEGRSKARLVGTATAGGGALGTELAYLRRAVTSGVAQGCADAGHGGLGRAALMCASIVCAGTGFVAERCAPRHPPVAPPPGRRPPADRPPRWGAGPAPPPRRQRGRRPGQRLTGRVRSAGPRCRPRRYRRRRRRQTRPATAGGR